MEGFVNYNLDICTANVREISMDQSFEELLLEFAGRAHEISRKGLVNCSSGNLSCRLSDSEMLISKTGTWLEKLMVDEISVVNIQHGKIRNEVEPSGEWKLHTAVFRKRADVNVVLHFQSPAATSLACLAEKPDYNAIIEVPLYIGNVPHLPFLMPGSDQLAEAVAEQSTHSNVIQMGNHGQVVLGKSFDEAIERAVFFELCCTIILNTGNRYHPIPAEFIPQLKNYRK